MADQVAGGLLSPLLRRARIRAALPHLRGRILDAGCGTGELAKWCETSGYWGVDIDEESLASARAQNPQLRFSTDLTEGETFDTIVGLAIIEHVRNPREWLEDLKSLLAPGGKIILTTPHLSMESIHRAGSAVGLFSRDAADEHETLFDEATMRDTAGLAGFRLALARRFLFRANQLFLLEPLP